VVIASHLLLLLKPPYPEPVLKSLLIESYPTLASYSQRIYDLAFTTGTLDIRFASMSMSIGDFLPMLPKGRGTKKPPNSEDVQFKRIRWGFFGLVAGAFAAYLAVVTRNLEIKWVEVEEGNAHVGGEEDGEGDEEVKQEKEPQKP
jgi:sorting and assembly machinery component 37